MVLQAEDDRAPTRARPLGQAPSEAEFLRHLELAHASATRAAQNGFVAKVAAVITVSVLLSLGPGKAVVALAPTLVFWGLDAHYLALERRYRMIYDEVRRRHTRPAADPFALDPGVYAAKAPIFFTAQHLTVWPVYATLLAMILVVVLRG